MIKKTFGYFKDSLLRSWRNTLRCFSDNIKNAFTPFDFWLFQGYRVARIRFKTNVYVFYSIEVCIS